MESHRPTPCRTGWKPCPMPKTGGPFNKILLDHGDLLTMSGATQDEYLQSVLRCRSTTQARINVTFRFTAQHAPFCPLRANCFRSYRHRGGDADGGPNDYSDFGPSPPSSSSSRHALFTTALHRDGRQRGGQCDGFTKMTITPYAGQSAQCTHENISDVSSWIPFGHISPFRFYSESKPKAPF